MSMGQIYQTTSNKQIWRIAPLTPHCRRCIMETDKEVAMTKVDTTRFEVDRETGLIAPTFAFDRILFCFHDAEHVLLARRLG